MDYPDLVFGHACPQHPDRAIDRVWCDPVRVAAGERWLVTVQYGCGHRHTQYSPLAPESILDTRGHRHPVRAEQAG